MTLAAGTPIGKYVVRRKLAEGGMAEIYLAAALGPEGFEKDVVIKRVRPGLAGDPEFVKMFIAEARVASRLNHANLVHIFDFDKHQDTYYLAMEYVRGHSLFELRRRCQERGVAIPPILVAQIGTEVARGLAYAHRLTENGQSLGLVHRDVTPHNVLLSFDGAVKLTDFGIAKAGGRATTSGMLKGKFAYMSPEQARGDAVDARTDVFALGVTLWELLTGARLFEGDGRRGGAARGAGAAHRSARPPQPRRRRAARRRGDAGAGARPGPPLAHRARAGARPGRGGALGRALARGHRRRRVPPPDVPRGGGGGRAGARHGVHPHLARPSPAPAGGGADAGAAGSGVRARSRRSAWSRRRPSLRRPRCCPARARAGRRWLGAALAALVIAAVAAAVVRTGPARAAWRERQRTALRRGPGTAAATAQRASPAGAHGPAARRGGRRVRVRLAAPARGDRASPTPAAAVPAPPSPAALASTEPDATRGAGEGRPRRAPSACRW